MAIAYLTLFSLAACQQRAVEHLPLPPERMVCAAAGDRPAIPDEYQIDWNSVQTVPQARSEHNAFVRSIRSREGVIGGYLVDIEGKLFICSDNMEWIRDREAGVG